ncbi:hypothetical protein [Thalassotalea agariperforans]
MTQMNNRYIKIDGWIFEIKAVRAIRTDSYGEPYNAIANFNLQNDTAFIDGLMTRTEDDFSRSDHNTFEKFFAQIGIKKVTFERFCNQQFQSYSRDVSDAAVQPPLKLVK